jgi:hypothetical protein
VLDLNEPTYRAAVGDCAGQFPGLGSLLPDLVNNDFDPDWGRFLRVFLLNDGSNMRNLVAHGFVDETDLAAEEIVGIGDVAVERHRHVEHRCGHCNLLKCGPSLL